MAWMFNGSEFKSEDIGQAVGMVYLITHVASGRFYIGQKVFHSKRTLPPLKGQTRKRKKIVESDWQSYFGSSDELKALVAQEGEQAFKREILYLCQSKSEMNYIEAVVQLKHNVLFNPLSFNGIVNCRVSRKHLKTANSLVTTLALNIERESNDARYS